VPEHVIVINDRICGDPEKLFPLLQRAHIALPYYVFEKSKFTVPMLFVGFAARVADALDKRNAASVCRALRFRTRDHQKPDAGASNLASLDGETKRSVADANVLGRLAQVHPSFRFAAVRLVTGDFVIGWQGTTRSRVQ